MKDAGNDPKLHEIKEVLRRLQHLDIDTETLPQLPSGTPSRRFPLAIVASLLIVASAAALSFLYLRDRQTLDLGQLVKRDAGPATSNVVVSREEASSPDTIGSASAHQLLVTGRNDTAPTTAPDADRTPSKEEDSTPGTNIPLSISTTQAQELMRTGRVLAARSMLLEESDGGSEDVALSLARSYDPNFLREIGSADAGPDVTEAEHWYRRWHEIAQQKGLVSDGVALDRLIRSMR